MKWELLSENVAIRLQCLDLSMQARHSNGILEWVPSPACHWPSYVVPVPCHYTHWQNEQKPRLVMNQAWFTRTQVDKLPLAWNVQEIPLYRDLEKFHRAGAVWQPTLNRGLLSCGRKGPLMSQCHHGSNPISSSRRVLCEWRMEYVNAQHGSNLEMRCRCVQCWKLCKDINVRHCERGSFIKLKHTYRIYIQNQ